MLNIDETGHPDSGQRLWTWGFHAPRPQGFTLFHIDPSRSSEVLKEFLGETFRGVVGCDYLSAYRKFLHDIGAAMQFCWAHLIRDVKYLVTLPDAVTRRFGEKLLETIKHLFRTWHRRDQMPAERWSRAAEQAKRAVLKVARRPPTRSEAENFGARFRQHSEHYFRFLGTPGVEPTNNAMEQRFRFVVIDRRITQGTRGETGRRWCERIWTVLATCAQQGRSAFDFLYDSIVAYFSKQPIPSPDPADIGTDRSPRRQGDLRSGRWQGRETLPQRGSPASDASRCWRRIRGCRRRWMHFLGASLRSVPPT